MSGWKETKETEGKKKKKRTTEIKNTLTVTRAHSVFPPLAPSSCRRAAPCLSQRCCPRSRPPCLPSAPWPRTSRATSWTTPAQVKSGGAGGAHCPAHCLPPPTASRCPHALLPVLSARRRRRRDAALHLNAADHRGRAPQNGGRPQWHAPPVAGALIPLTMRHLMPSSCLRLQLTWLEKTFAEQAEKWHRENVDVAKVQATM